jgi:cell division protein ZapA (FtsZ GTPase activity inhibitor)
VPLSDLRLDILGISFPITADEDPAYVEEILNQYRKEVDKTQKNTGAKDPLKTAILTGILLCDEIYKLRRQAEPRPEDNEVEKRTLNLIALIDKALEKNSAPNE